MSKETLEHLNTQTLIGFTDKRGTAWHYKAELQGEESNHYPGAIPRPDIERRLFDWQAIEGQVTATALTDDGVVTYTDPTRKAIMRSDTGHILGLFKEGYQIHQHTDVLLDGLSDILDSSDMGIGSAGLLENGAVAWVQVEVPDNIETPEGVVFRPNLLAVGSHNGKYATTYQRTVTNVVCDNTMSAALGEGSAKVKVRHSRYSNIRLESARHALDILYGIADTFSAQVAALTGTKVSEADWNQFLETLVPIADDAKLTGITRAENKRNALKLLWHDDARVTPWKGTAYGVLQAVNTYAHHVQGNDATRAARNATRAVAGKVDTLDRDTLAILSDIVPVPAFA